MNQSTHHTTTLSTREKALIAYAVAYYELRDGRKARAYTSSKLAPTDRLVVRTVTRAVRRALDKRTSA
jgi:hypothetical protein